MEIELACCGFVDLLGLKALHRFPFEVGLKAYQEAVESNFPYFPQHFLDLNDSLASTWTKEYDPSLRYSVLSDCLVVRGATIRWPVSLTIWMASHCLQMGIAVRGGLATRRHYEKTDGPHLFMFSEAYTRAVSLESLANVPRVILAPDALAQLREPFLPRSDRAVATCVQCEDDLWALNLLPQDYDFPVLARIVDRVREHMGDSVPDGIRKKWVWLGDYFNAMVWGRNGVYEQQAKTSFRQFARHLASRKQHNFIAPTWEAEDLPEFKFFLLRASQSKVNPFTRSFEENTRG
jgi:hypothetical protein